MNLLYISHVPKISLEDTSFSKALRKTLMEWVLESSKSALMNFFCTLEEVGETIIEISSLILVGLMREVNPKW
jgi:hypothetical protein